MYVVDRWHQFRESVQEKNVKEFDFCSNPLPRLSKMREVEELLSRKAFEKLATHQDLSNAIEKVFFRSEFLKKSCVPSISSISWLVGKEAAGWLVLVPYHPQAFASLLRYLHIGTYNIYVKNIGLSKKDVRDVVVVQSSKIAL